MRHLSSALAAGFAVLAASAVGVSTGQAADPARYVSPSGNDTANLTCDKTHPCKTVQHAVDVATPGDTVHVAAGTYAEQVVIGINVTVSGAGVDTTVIQAPPILVPNSDTGDGQTSIVEITNGATDKLSGLTVAGPGPGGCGSINAGISVRHNATLKLSTAKVRDIHDTPAGGCQNGDGVSVGSKCFTCAADVGHAFIKDVQVIDYQKNGVAVRGAGSSLQLHDSLIQTQPSVWIAANGVEVLSGATGDVRENTITGNECNNHNIVNSHPVCGVDVLDPNLSWGSGVLVLGTDSSTVVSDNHISANDVGIYTNDGITIKRNKDSNNRAAGMYVDTGATKAYIAGNTTSADGGYGIVVGPGGNLGGNVFKDNTAFSNSTYDLYQSSDAGANTNNDNHCGTAWPSTVYWDCESKS